MTEQFFRDAHQELVGVKGSEVGGRPHRYERPRTTSAITAAATPTTTRQPTTTGHTPEPAIRARVVDSLIPVDPARPRPAIWNQADR